MKQEILLHYCITYIGHFLQCSAECLALFFCEAGSLKGHSALFRQSSAVIFLWVLDVQFLQYTCKQSRQKQLPAKMTNLFTLKAISLRSLFNVHHPLEIIYTSRRIHVSLLGKNLSS